MMKRTLAEATTSGMEFTRNKLTSQYGHERWLYVDEWGKMRFCDSDEAYIPDAQDISASDYQLREPAISIYRNDLARAIARVIRPHHVSVEPEYLIERVWDVLTERASIPD